MVGTGRGARAGILIRNAEALETFGKVDTLIIDKTGTLTEGKPTLSSVIPQPDIDECYSWAKGSRSESHYGNGRQRYDGQGSRG